MVVHQQPASDTITPEAERRLLDSLHHSRPVTELTHNFYRYPARMSPRLPRELIALFTQPGDTVLDPFMGGGTTIVESLAAGRHAIGVDLNPLAVFVASAKTTQLHARDHRVLREWAQGLDLTGATVIPAVEAESRVKNLPEESLPLFARAVESIRSLPLSRQQRFARCVLLRTGQWALDCKTEFPNGEEIKQTFLAHLEDMLARLDEFVQVVRSHDVGSRRVTRRRKLFLRSIVGAEHEHRLAAERGNVKLVVTSPPYPGVHVLYHRWQVQGRRETPAPYWLIGAQDGHGASYYTMGDRKSILGREGYFRTLIDSYTSVRSFLHPDALVVQLVAFADVASQLPAFLGAMQSAGYTEASPVVAGREQLWRSVPSRKWYNYLDSARHPARELLLFHRPAAR
ncbi:MAG: hypothetical protein M3Q29_00400 [Chloroflexota bacterium]|nr:hypothetical protein [Chloroflexota bacterium]